MSMFRWLAVAILTSLASVANAQITFFTDCNFLGKSVTLPVGQYTAADMQAAGLPANSISAAVVPEGFTATLYTEDRYGGRSGVLKRTSSCLDGDNFDNIVSSMTVQVAGTENASAQTVLNRQIKPRQMVTVYAECRYQGVAASLPAGEYSLAELQKMGISNNDISSISVPPGFQATLYENDFFRGRNIGFTKSDQCLRGDGMDNVVSSLVITGALQNNQSTAQTQATAPSNTNAANTNANTSTAAREDTISIFSECNFKGLGFRLRAGKYLASDFEKLGMPNNSISSLRIPRGFVVTVYENDFFRGDAKVLQADDSCLIGDQLNDKISSMVVESVAATSANQAQVQTQNQPQPNQTTATIAAKLYSKCRFTGAIASLPVGDYNSADLQRLGIKDNALSSVSVTPGYQIELFFYDFQRGKSGYLREDDDCLANDGFDNEVSSVKVTRIDGDDKPLTQVDTVARAATVYQHCDFKGGNVSLTAGRYTQEKLRQLGIGNDVISSLKVSPGYQVVLYDNGQLRGQGVVVEGNDGCLDDNGMYRKVSSLSIGKKPQTRPAATAASGRDDSLRAAVALDASLECVALYVERDICDARRWPDIVKRCKLAEAPLMTDGYLQDHVERGNCTSRYWTQIVQRVREPSLR